MNNIDKIIEANNLIENLKSAILSNVIVKIKDSETKELLWCCHTGEYYGWLKKKGVKLEVEQDIELYTILLDLKKVIDGQI